MRLLLASFAAMLFGCTGSTELVDSGVTGGGGGEVAAGGGVATGGGGQLGGGGGSLGGGGGGSGGGATGGGAGGGGGASTVDAGLSCAGRTWKFCEDFESGAPGALPSGWMTLMGWGQGTIAVSMDSAHDGTKSLKSSSPNTGEPRAQHSLSSLGATAGTHWGRVFYRVATPAPNASNTSQWFHITFVGLRANDESRVVDTVQSPSGTIQYLYNLPDDSCCNGSSYDWRYDGNWHCAEWYVNNGTDAYRFFLDGTELTSLAFTGKTEARLADFTSIALGAIYYVPSNGTLTTYLDDLAIDDARIGCQ